MSGAEPSHLNQRAESLYWLMEHSLKSGNVTEASRQASVLLDMVDRGVACPTKFTGKADACSVLRFVRGLADE